MAPLMSKSPKLDVKDLKQQAAMPLSNFLRRDPWTDQVITMHTSYEPLLSPGDKMPFEVTPVYIKLAYYKPPADAAAAPAGNAAAPADATQAPPAAADPNQPAAGAAAPAAPAQQPAAPAQQPAAPPQN
jgi:hypothetical protein